MNRRTRAREGGGTGNERRRWERGGEREKEKCGRGGEEGGSTGRERKEVRRKGLVRQRRRAWRGGREQRRREEEREGKREGKKEVHVCVKEKVKNLVSHYTTVLLYYLAPPSSLIC